MQEKRPRRGYQWSKGANAKSKANLLGSVLFQRSFPLSRSSTTSLLAVSTATASVKQCYHGYVACSNAAASRLGRFQETTSVKCPASTFITAEDSQSTSAKETEQLKTKRELRWVLLSCTLSLSTPQPNSTCPSCPSLLLSPGPHTH